MKLQQSASVSTQDPPFMTNHEQLTRLDVLFEQFTTVNIKLDKFNDIESEQPKMEDMYIYLIS